MGVFKTIRRFVIVPTYPALVPRINGSEIRHGIFWGFLVQGFFGRFCLKPLEIINKNAASFVAVTTVTMVRGLERVTNP